MKNGFEEWGLVGGHPKHNESVVDCTLRETFEETGITLNKIKFTQNNK